MKPLSELPKTGGQRAFQLEGADGFSLRVQFGAHLLRDGTYDVYVDVEGGPTRRFTYDPVNGKEEAEKARLGRQVTSALIEEIESRIGQLLVVPSSSDESTAVPQLALDRDGT